MRSPPWVRALAALGALRLVFAAIVPVTNLIFRLSDHGPGYQDDYAAQPGIQGLPYENVDEYIRRSPVYHVQNLKVPILVHVATNDCDVFFREDQQMVYTLRALKPDLAETKVYVDPPPGRGGQRRAGAADPVGALRGRPALQGRARVGRRTGNCTDRRRRACGRRRGSRGPR